MADRVVAVVTRCWGGTDGAGKYTATRTTGITIAQGPSNPSSTFYDSATEAQLVCQNALGGRPLRWVRNDLAFIESWEGHLEV
jgi:hypothetical protein